MSRILLGILASVGSKNFFGDGSDGAVTISTNTSLTVTADTGHIVKHYESLTINDSVFLTAANRCQSMLIYVEGDCVINGSLLMDDRGANATPTEDSDIYRHTSGSGEDSTAEAANTTLFPDEAGNQDVGVAFAEYGALQAGATGGAAAAVDQPGNDGDAGTAGQTGGGGGGAGGTHDNGGGVAADGTSFSGGPGGGGGGGGLTGNSGSGATSNGGQGGDGGAGGDDAGGGGGGGAGNPGGSGAAGVGVGQPGDDGDPGTGGTLILIVGGDLTIGASAIISADGSDGGDGGDGGSDGGGGGGSGGGTVSVLYAGILSNSGTIRADGGAGGLQFGAGSRIGGDGGAGSVRTVKISR